MVPDSRNFEPIASCVIERAVEGWAKDALRIISKSSETTAYLSGIDPEGVRWSSVTHDLETSRHTPDDRDTYVLEGKTGDSLVRFTVDVVHREDGVDRFGHAVFFGITHGGHEIEGTVMFHLPEDEDPECRTCVQVWSIENAD